MNQQDYLSNELRKCLKSSFPAPIKEEENGEFFLGFFRCGISFKWLPDGNASTEKHVGTIFWTDFDDSPSLSPMIGQLLMVERAKKFFAEAPYKLKAETYTDGIKWIFLRKSSESPKEKVISAVYDLQKFLIEEIRIWELEQISGMPLRWFHQIGAEIFQCQQKDARVRINGIKGQINEWERFVGSSDRWIIDRFHRALWICGVKDELVPLMGNRSPAENREILKEYWPKIITE